MSNNILFVFEGEKTEVQIVNNLQKNFLDLNIIIKSVYSGEIYQIYTEIKADEDLDTFNLIKDRNNAKNSILNNYKRSDFAEIYLFFDYDGHSSLADDSKLKDLITFFNQETDKGKLYISYPMVEALKHICDYNTFKDLAVPCKQNIGYKSIVGNSSLKELSDFRKYDLNIWKFLITAHLKKINFITAASFTFPNKLVSQSDIFINQLEKYININSTVAVVSGFPLFIHDYYGNDELKKKIEQ